MRIAIVTDSTSDIPQAKADALGVQVVPLYVNFKGKAHKDRLEIKPQDIFTGMQAGADPPSTSQPSPADFKAAYEQALQKADHVLSIHVSSKLSGTVSSAQLAASEFPGRVTVVDSLNVSSGLGMMIERAHELLAQGSPLSSVVNELERIKNDYTLRFTVATLEFLKRNGRIGGARALLGTLLGIKPILTVTKGAVEAAGRARGEKKAIEDIVGHFKQWGQGRRNIRVYFIYTGDAQAVEGLRQGILASGLPLQEGYTTELGAVVATHTGPNAYGFFAYSH